MAFVKRLSLILIFLAGFYALPLEGQGNSVDSSYAIIDTIQADFGLFSNDEILQLSLRFDITQYTRKKSKDEYLNAILTYHISDKDSINKNIRLKSRGEFRNSYCDFPPIKLNFKKTEFASSDLNEIEKLKLVTHCVSRNEEYLLREYLVYKLYNVLTDHSFRVRLLEINYINTSRNNKTIKSYGFIIEPLDLLADRTNSVPVNSMNLTQVNISQVIMDRAAIFNYMIGNTDWSVPNQHNCKILSAPDSERPDQGIIVPYDFDYTGMVDARYAIPYEALGIKSVRDRLYVGICRSEEVFRNALLEFSDKKMEFYKVINEFPYLSDKVKKKMINYLDSFYAGFDKRNSIVNDFLISCKQINK